VTAAALTVHEMPAEAFDAWETALGHVPIQVSVVHHEAGLYLDQPLGSVVLENHRYYPTTDSHALWIRGMAFTRGPA
jgi:hypothetical protein